LGKIAVLFFAALVGCTPARYTPAPPDRLLPETKVEGVGPAEVATAMAKSGAGAKAVAPLWEISPGLSEAPNYSGYRPKVTDGSKPIVPNAEAAISGVADISTAPGSTVRSKRE